MPKLATRALTALAIATVLPAAACAQSIDWNARPAEKAGLTRLRIERTAPGSRNSNEDDVVVPGLDLARDGDQRFVLRREAGTLACSGVVRARRGVGACRFTADPRFADTLSRYGMARPSESESFTLAMVDAHAATATALGRFGAHPSLGDFVALSVHGASPEWLDGLAGAGQRNVKAGELIAYRIHGVSGAWLRGLIAADPVLAGESGGNIIAMRIHGVTPEWIQELADAGYRRVAAGDLIAMRIHGVTPEFARAAAAMRPRPTSDELIAQRIHGSR